MHRSTATIGAVTFDMSDSLLRRVIPPPDAERRGPLKSPAERIISALPMVLMIWLAAMMVLVPMPFASVTIFWSTVLRVGAFVALALALASGVLPREPRPLFMVAAVGVLLAAMGLWQSLPMPGFMVGLLSPGHVEHVEATRALVGEEVAVRASLSVSPAASRSAALGWLAMAAAFVAAGICGRERKSRKMVIGVFLGMAFLQVIFGVQRMFAGATVLWGIDIPGAAGRLRGTFVNADHLALYLEIALAVTFAWSYRAIRQAASEKVPERKVIEVSVPIIFWLILFVGLAFTGSRAGLVAAAIATVAQGIFLAGSLKSWRLAPAGLMAGILGVVVVAWIGLQQGLGRILGTSSYEVAWNQRPMVYLASLELWKKFPIFGTGMGTFEVAFPTVQPEAVTGGLWTHAHNDWLEILVTTGVVGFAILLVGVFVLLEMLRRVLLGSRSSSSRAAALGALGAVVAVSFHEALDFGLAMPANAFTLAVVLGLAVGVSRDYE